jgi:hypothetical protein
MFGLAWFSYKEGKESFEKSSNAPTCCGIAKAIGYL